MTIVSVLYPKTEDSHFDHEYYMQKHIPLATVRFTEIGLEKTELIRGVASADGAKPAYELIGLLYFSSEEAVRAALETHGAEILGDIPNFTNVQPLIQFNQAA
jgi:uncharacterized protein (TIGR02118 family)